MRLQLLILCFVAAVFGDKSYPELEPSARLSRENSVVCRAVKQSSSKNGHIDLKLEKISDENQKIPVFVFHYIDVDEFDSLPPWRIFENQEQKHESKIYNSDGDFIAAPKNSEYSYNYEGIQLSQSQEHRFNVTKSGIYCVYAHEPKDVDHFSISVVSKNSYGYLPYPLYIVYGQNYIVIVLYAILAGGLLHYLITYKVKKNFQNLNDISIISKAMIFYILIPTIASTVLQTFCLAIGNYMPGLDKNSLFIVVPSWINSSLAVFIRFFTLLFSMGYGVIYCSKEDSDKYKKIPENLWKRAKTLLVIDLFSFSFSFLTLSLLNLPQLDKVNDNNILIQGLVYVNFLLGMVYSVFPIVWLIFSIIHYTRTKTSISKFPVTSDPQNNMNLLEAFRKSFLIVFVFPFVSFVILMAFLMLNGDSTAIQPPAPTGDAASDIILQDTFLMKILEMLIFNLSSEIGFIWSNNSYTIMAVVLVFIIWTRNNYGIVLDGKEDYFGIADEDET